MCFFSNLEEKYSIYCLLHFESEEDHLPGKQVHSSGGNYSLHNMNQSFTEVFLTHVATTVGTNSVIAFPLETSREDAVVAMATL